MGAVTIVVATASNGGPHATEERVVSLKNEYLVLIPSQNVILIKYIVGLTLCIGSGSSIISSKLPEMARFNSGPAACSVRRPACRVMAAL